MPPVRTVSESYSCERYISFVREFACWGSQPQARARVPVLRAVTQDQVARLGTFRVRMRGIGSSATELSSSLLADFEMPSNLTTYSPHIVPCCVSVWIHNPAVTCQRLSPPHSWLREGGFSGGSPLVSTPVKSSRAVSFSIHLAVPSN